MFTDIRGHLAPSGYAPREAKPPRMPENILVDTRAP